MINNAANMLVVNGYWEQTEDDGVESLVDKEDLMCCHLMMDPFDDSDDKEFSVSDETTYEPLVETVDEEATSKFVYKDAEELFPTADTCAEPKSMQDMEPDVEDMSPVYEEHREHTKETLHQELSDADLVITLDTSNKMCPDFPQGEE